MKTIAISIMCTIISLCLIILLAACGGGGSGGTAATTSTSQVGSTSQSSIASQSTGSITVQLASSSAKSTSKTLYAIPSGIVTIRVTVMGTDLTSSITQDFPVSSIVNSSVTITGVPAGTYRTVAVLGLDASGKETCMGTCLVSVTAGSSTNAGTVILTEEGSFNMSQALTDNTQVTTLAFSALAMVTGNLGAQSFFPPGKVADYTGFQYLRDNDSDGMGHNTSFLTRVAENVMYILTDAQLAKLTALAVAQQTQISNYGNKRYPLMKAFRRLLAGDLPSGTTSLSLAAVKAASKELYLIDGQISYDRAVLYAEILNSLTDSQKTYLASMKGNGWNSWPDTSSGLVKIEVDRKKTLLPSGSMVAVMTYSGDLFSWYAGSVAADVYFCPERHGTYFGSFFMKDAPAVGHEGYSISTTLTGEAGLALSSSTHSGAIVNATQAATMSSVVDLQRSNLYSGSTNIVSVRTQIATLLRSLLTTTDTSGTVLSKVLALSGTYGELDGENNYNYAMVVAKVYATLSDAQKTSLMDLRAEIMSGTYTDGSGAFNYTYSADYYLYSDKITTTEAEAAMGVTTGFFQ